MRGLVCRITFSNSSAVIDSDALLSKISKAVRYNASGLKNYYININFKKRNLYAQRVASNAQNSSNDTSPSLVVSAALARRRTVSLL